MTKLQVSPTFNGRPNRLGPAKYIKKEDRTARPNNRLCPKMYTFEWVYLDVRGNPCEVKMGANPEYVEGEVIANKYVVEGPLGESPAARVYLANGNFISQKICVKIYRPEVSEGLISAPDFFLKAAAMGEIEHDNICASLDVQEEMGMVFVARSFAEGQSYEDWLPKARSEANYYPRGLELLWQISQGLIAIHERTRHLNIHPGNIIVGAMVAKLCDWDPRALSNTEMSPNTLPVRSEYHGYRAPEARGPGSFLSYPSTDLFAVAGLLYRLLKGENPPPSTTKVQQDLRNFDNDIGAFLSKALHPKPEERFQEASAFSDALWDLKGAMQRIQDKNGSFRQKPGPVVQENGPIPQPSKPTPTNEPTKINAPPEVATTDDFFDFFPAVDAKPTATTAGMPRHTGGDTLFGTAEMPSPPKSSLGDLGTPGTLFGSSAPLFAEPSKPKYKQEAPKPIVVKPLAVSLSSLEKDPLDLAGGNSTGGFTQFGFKGADQNRTGIFTPEQKTANAKRKLMIIFAAMGGLIVLIGLGGLFLYLRGSATSKVAEASAKAAVIENEPPKNIPTSTREEPKSSELTNPEPPTQAPIVSQKTPEVETHVEPTVAKTPKPVSNPIRNGKVSPEREAALMAMVQTRTWPASASERLNAANEFNDMGKTAEANVAYGKALIASDVSEKQKILALGGLAVTFKSMGMVDQARESVQRILAINPKNGFALKLQAEFK